MLRSSSIALILLATTLGAAIFWAMGGAGRGDAAAEGFGGDALALGSRAGTGSGESGRDLGASSTGDARVSGRPIEGSATPFLGGVQE